MNFYVKDGKLFPMDIVPQKILVGSEDDLPNADGFAPGTIAYTVGMGTKWYVTPAGEWQESAGGGGGSSGSSVFKIGVDTATDSLDKTWQEIHDALEAGKVCVIITETENGYICEYVITVAALGDDGYGVVTLFGAEQPLYTTISANGYPVYNDNGNP